VVARLEQKRYQVFISSTFVDLQTERLAVLNQLLSINCIPVGMEIFPAADEEQFKYIKKLIRESDYYVLIVAGRYGSLAKDGLSYTEKEYDYAIKKKIPVLAFLHKDPGKIASELTDPKHAEKLTAFREKIENSNRLVKYWTTADNLRADVQTALSYAFTSKPRKGWVRDDSFRDSSQLKKDLNQANKIIKEKQEKTDSYQRECEELKRTIDSLQREREELKKTIDSFQQECEKLMVELEESRAHESTFTTQQAELEKARRHMSELEIKLAEREKSISELQTQLDESSEKEERLRLQLAQSGQKPGSPPPLAEPPVKNKIYTMGHWNDEPLEWLVLEVLPDRALLITKDCLLQAPYNKEQVNTTWEECSLRKEVLPQLLEQIFYEDIERDRVLLWKNRNPNNLRYNTAGGTDTDDKLFILSIDEARQYFPDNEARIAYLNGEAVWWWLRSPGYYGYFASIVLLDGYVHVNGYDESSSAGGVRPAFWLNLKS